MNINKINNTQSFQAKFVKNQAILNLTKEEIRNGNEEEYINALNNLSKRHSNVALLLSKNEEGEYSVTNLYNKKTLYFDTFNSETIDSLADIKSPDYKRLFTSDKLMTPARTANTAKAISERFFVNSTPDYTLGRKIDALF